MKSILRRMVNPLRSRKTRVALATVLAAYGAEYGLNVSDEMLFTILGIGVSLILGIAHEDNGKHVNGDGGGYPAESTG